MYVYTLGTVVWMFFDTLVWLFFDTLVWSLLNGDAGLDLDLGSDEGMLTDGSMIAGGLMELMTDSFNRENISFNLS